jgi:SAM-dependent methyltransferase
MTATLAPARMLNVGCGRRFHPAWENLDVAPHHRSVRRADIVDGIPYPDQHFDVVYHSHVLEHIRPKDVPAFLRECHRVLKPGGITRIATPDLEQLCAVYLQTLRASATDDHQWMVIELLDQTVREQSGGSMLEYLRRQPLTNESFVLERIGEEGRELLNSVRGTTPPPSSTPESFGNRMRRRIKEGLVTRWYGADALQAMQIGRFRRNGEVHQWLYDRLSLAQVLASAGFCEPMVRAAGESAISGWRAFFLETTQTGQPIKPDSIFMEARKPE